MVNGQRRLDQDPWVPEGDNFSACIRVIFNVAALKAPLGDIWEYLESFLAKIVVRDATGIY